MVLELEEGGQGLIGFFLWGPELSSDLQLRALVMVPSVQEKAGCFERQSADLRGWEKKMNSVFGQPVESGLRFAPQVPFLFPGSGLFFYPVIQIKNLSIGMVASQLLNLSVQII